MLEALGPPRPLGAPTTPVTATPRGRCADGRLWQAGTTKRCGRITASGTTCSDNTSTEEFLWFRERLTDRPGTVIFLGFRADHDVEIRFEVGARREIPFLRLPISDLLADIFPLARRTFVDDTNSLADSRVGYMARLRP